MICSPRPVSAREPRPWGTGTARLGSATAHSTQDPGCSRPSRIGRRGGGSPGQGRACRSALVSSSVTTIAMSSPRSAASHRRRVARVKSRAAWTDPASVPGVHVTIRGWSPRPVRQASGAGCPLSRVRPAVSAASISQRQSLLSAGCSRRRSGSGGLAGRRWLAGGRGSRPRSPAAPLPRSPAIRAALVMAARRSHSTTGRETRKPDAVCWHRGQANRPRASTRQPAPIARARMSASPSAA